MAKTKKSKPEDAEAVANIHPNDDNRPVEVSFESRNSGNTTANRKRTTAANKAGKIMKF